MPHRLIHLLIYRGPTTQVIMYVNVRKQITTLITRVVMLERLYEEPKKGFKCLWPLPLPNHQTPAFGNPNNWYWPKYLLSNQALAFQATFNLYWRIIHCVLEFMISMTHETETYSQPSRYWKESLPANCADITHFWVQEIVNLSDLVQICFTTSWVLGLYILTLGSQRLILRHFHLLHSLDPSWMLCGTGHWRYMTN